MTGNWWAVALRAAAAILLGIVALVSPIGTLATLVTVFGFYAIADGVLAIVVAVRGVRSHDHWGWMFVAGIIGIAAGTVVILDPAIGALAFTWLVAAWALVTGAFEIAAAIKLRKIISGEWLLALAGVLSVILGLRHRGVSRSRRGASRVMDRGIRDRLRHRHPGARLADQAMDARQCLCLAHLPLTFYKATDIVSL